MYLQENYRPPAHSEAAQVLRENHEVVLRVRQLVDNARNGMLHDSGISTSFLDQAEYEDSESARRVWTEMREERSALLAVLLEDAWVQFEREMQASPSGLTESWNSVRKRVSPEELASDRKPLHRIVGSFRNMVQWTLEEWQHEHEARPASDDPMNRNFRRLHAMLDFGRRHDITYKHAAGYFSNGFSGAIQMHVGTTEVAPKVYQREVGGQIPADVYSSLIRGSYHQMFSLPAHFDQSVGVPMMNCGFNQDANSAIGIALDPEMLTIRDGSLQRKRPLPIPPKAIEMAHLGCSALHAKTPSGFSVNRATFNFLTDLTVDHHVSRY